MTLKSTAKSLYQEMKGQGVCARRLNYAFVKLIPCPQEKAISFLNEKRFFLITSTGRTGTTLFANMLNTLKDHYVVHEPVLQEQFYHRKALEYPEFSLQYIKEFRLKEMYLRVKKQKNLTRYGEVNSALRRNLEAIKLLIPNSQLAHVIRDGRDVVASILNRNTFTKDDKIYNGLFPDDLIIRRERWRKMNRFQKIVTMWKVENQYMQRNCDLTARFEELVSSYDYAKETLFDPLGLPIDHATWKHFVGSKVNARRKDESRYSYGNWSENEKRFFWDECGDEMLLHGYSD